MIRNRSIVFTVITSAGTFLGSSLPVAATPLGAATVTATTQDAQSIIATMHEKQAERWATVQNYTVTLAIEQAANLQQPMYYEKIEVDGQPTFRLVPRTEYDRQVFAQAGFQPLDSAGLEAFAEGYDMLGEALATGGDGSPPVDLRSMTSEMSTVMRMGASYHENDGRADAARDRHEGDELTRRAKLMGTERTESGREAFLLVADDLFDIPLEQPKDAGEFRLEKASIWIDTEYYVPLRYKLDGQVTQGNTTTPITIEKLEQNYRQVGPLYESHRQVMRITGLMAGMSDKDRKEMEQARKDLAKIKKQLKDMPDGPGKAMAIRMMQPQIDRFERMAAGDTIQAETHVVSIAINEGPPSFYGTGELYVGSVSFPGALTLAADASNEGGRVAGGIFFAAALDGEAEASISLIGAHSFFEGYGLDAPVPISGPGSTGAMAIRDARGSVHYQDGRAAVQIQGGSGTITVALRTETRIVGMFEAQLTTSTGATLRASGRFDCGAPLSADHAPRGSPFPAALFGRP
jgi:hypothetical protein